jgi:peptide/nickel transport system ATP-binding protein
MNDVVLDVRNLQVQFHTDEKQIQAVDDISFQVRRGQTLGIVGESGSGKSVTSLAIMGLVPSPPGRVTAGDILFYNDPNRAPINLRTLPTHRIQRYRGGEIAMIFQEPMSSLNPVYTIGFQLVEAVRLHQRVSVIEAKRVAIASLQEVKLLPSDEALRLQFLTERGQTEDTAEVDKREVVAQMNRYKQAMLDRYPHQLSGGQIQRVMIAMAIACNPRLLIADEPTTALDVTVQATILNLLRELRDHHQMSMMFITHDLGVIAEIADTVAVMYQGKIVETGSVRDIFTNPQHPYTQGLLACRPQPDKRLRYLPTIADFMETQGVSRAEEVVDSGSNGAIISDATPSLPHHPGFVFQELTELEIQTRLDILQQQPPLLTVENLQVGFPVRGQLGQTQRYTMAVNGVSFYVYPGETLGLVGESGCGKTTLSRTLLRLIEPMSGRVMFEEREVTALKSRQLRQLRRDMQIIFQDPFSSLNPRLSVGEAVMEPLTIHQMGSRQQNLERVRYLLDRVGLHPDWTNRYPHEFSGGQRQRICIARSLALNPRFIICDESVSALDVSVQAQVLNLLKELQSEFGLTYIFISHDLSVVKFMSDRIMVMNQGKIEEIGPAEEIYNQPEQAYTRQLIASIPKGEVRE